MRLWVDADPRARASDPVYAEHFQPASVLLDLVPDQVACFDHPLWFIAIREIDYARALRTEHVQA